MSAKSKQAKAQAQLIEISKDNFEGIEIVFSLNVFVVVKFLL